VKFKPVSGDAKPLALRSVRASDIGHLVTIKAMVTRVSDVKPLVSVVTYVCDVCGYELYQSVSQVPALSGWHRSDRARAMKIGYGSMARVRAGERQEFHAAQGVCLGCVQAGQDERSSAHAGTRVLVLWRRHCVRTHDVTVARVHVLRLFLRLEARVSSSIRSSRSRSCLSRCPWATSREP
jgi:hypothetical protein